VVQRTEKNKILIDTLHQCHKPGLFTISQRDIHAFTTRNRVPLSLLYTTSFH